MRKSFPTFIKRGLQAHFPVASEEMPNPGLPMRFLKTPDRLTKTTDLNRKYQTDKKLGEFFYCLPYLLSHKKFQ